MKHKNTWSAYCILLFSVILFLSPACKDNGSGPVRDAHFNFEISVRDIHDNPVGSLRVSAIGVLSIDPVLFKLNKRTVQESILKTSKIMASTSLGFTIVTGNAHVLLTVFNIKGEMIDTLIEGNLNRGSYSLTWNLPATMPSGVYKCLFIADSGSVHYRDSIYAVYHKQDPALNAIGWTQPDGSFEISDPTLFPAVCNIPPLIHTEFAPDSLGTFYYTDSVAVTLTDTTTREQQTFYIRINDQQNTHSLIWNPFPLPPQPPIINGGSGNLMKSNSVKIIKDVIPIPIPAEWKFDQNYPNPFN